MTLNNWFNKGLTEEEYLNAMTVNRDNMEKVASQYILKDADKAKSLQPHNLRALVLTADWCGDAMMNLPIFMAIAKEANIKAAYFIRDENLELMDQYLTNGTARSIPIIVLIDENGEEFAKWGPRAVKVQTMVDEKRKELPPQEDPAFETVIKEFYAMIGKLYTTDSTLWSQVEEDMLHTFVK
ncbi:thioredoxin family protein [Bacillus massiliigorillae]|uniref:thioredoxin family protein n=1 Tax=Bacillus massiliigorillae TaxID=1243664 RepID=UPI0003A3DABD|nr:thioredoxin family protein [Bacillus massiliigorillae]